MPGWSKSFLNPSMASALAAGRTFEQWLDGRTPAVSYARISADQSTRSAVLAKGRAAGTGVRHQHEENTETAASHGMAIVKFYEDNGITAAHPGIVRPAFAEMIRAVHYRRTAEGYAVQALVATERERVWRLPTDLARLHRAVTVTPDGAFVERGAAYDLHANHGLGGAGSGDGEVANTRERIARHIRRRAIDGGTPGGRRRFGWLGPDVRAGRKMNMLKDPDEWPILREMIAAALRGEGWNAIARDLNSRDIRTASDNRWSGATVRQALTNPVMCGYRSLHGDLVRHPSTGVPVTGQWDAPATVEEWRSLVEISRHHGAQRGTRLTNGSPPPGANRHGTRKYLFSGFLCCGALREDGTVCGARMSGRRLEPTERNPYNGVYVCAAMDCGGTARNMPDVDGYLQETVLSLLEEHYVNARRETPPWGGAELLDLLVEERKQLEGLRHMTSVSAAVPQLLAELDGRIAGLEAAREEDLAAQQDALSGWNRSRWAGMDLAQRRAAAARVLESVTVLPLPRGQSRRAPFDPGLLRIVPVGRPRGG